MDCIQRTIPFGCEKCNKPSTIITKAGITEKGNVVLLGECVKCHNKVAVDVQIVFEAFYPTTGRDN